MPLVSVVMPSYSHESFISEAIEGVLNQSCQDIELIIIDDASKDNSREIIKSYREKDSRIRAIFHNENKGIAKTFNDGIEEASGKFIAITGSDDVWLKDKLEKQLEILGENEDLVVHSDSLIIDAQSNFVEKLPAKKRNASKKKKSGKIFRELLWGNFICGSSMIFKRDNIKDIRFDEQLKYVNDYKFVLDLAIKYEYYFIPEPLVKYRIHGKNCTLHDGAGWLKDYALMGKYLLDKYENELPKKVKAKFLFNIGCDECSRGDSGNGRKYILKAIMTYPFRIEYFSSLISSFGTDSIMPKSLTRRILSEHKQ